MRLPVIATVALAAILSIGIAAPAHADPALAQTTTTVTATPASGLPGTHITLTATVSGANPSGNVQFFLNGSNLTTVPISAGAVQLGLSGLVAGSHTFTAEYIGDGNNAPSTSNAATVDLRLPTTTSLSAPDTVAGAPVTFSAHVTGDSPTGMVEFSSGGTILGNGIVDASGDASLTTRLYSAGSGIFVSARYAGDTRNAPSESSGSNTVFPASTTTVLTASPSSPTVGSDYVLTATVTGARPGDNVVFSEYLASGGTQHTRALDSSGVARLTISGSPVGTRTFRADYPGDANNLSSSTGFIRTSVTTTQAPSATVLSAPPTSLPGLSIDVYAFVTGVNPGGTVEFFDHGVSIGSSTLNGSGRADFTVTNPSVGTHNFTASYLGDTNNTTSGSLSVTTEVPKATSATTLLAAPSFATVGSPLVFTATVTGHDVGGNVEFFANGISLGTALLNHSGVATLNTATLAAGSHSVTAVYAEDANNTKSTSASSSIIITKATSATTVTVAPSSTIVGSALAFTATVTGYKVGGNVEFFASGTSLGTALLNGAGVATLNTSSLAVGTHSVTAVYAEDANNIGSTSPAVTAVVTSAPVVPVDPAPLTPTEIALSATTANTPAGTVAKLTATVTGGTPRVAFARGMARAAVIAGTPSGLVEFFANGKSLGTAPLNGVGVATFTTGALAPGSHTFTAKYVGSSNSASSNSTVVPVTVVPSAVIEPPAVTAPTPTTASATPAAAAAGKAPAAALPETGGNPLPGMAAAMLLLALGAAAMLVRRRRTARTAS